MVFVATADADGHPQCSYKGGEPGFVRVLDERTITLPSYDGNGMYLTAGNLLVNPHVGLLFIDFESRKRLRLNGVARSRGRSALPSIEAARRRVEATEVFELPALSTAPPGALGRPAMPHAGAGVSSGPPTRSRRPTPTTRTPDRRTVVARVFAAAARPWGTERSFSSTCTTPMWPLERGAASAVAGADG